MKKNEIFELKKSDRINHKHYGICVVVYVIPDFGPLIKPESEEGQKLLTQHSEMPAGTPLL